MKYHQTTTNLGILGGAAVVLMASQYAIAAETEITNILLNPTAEGVQVVLQTTNGQQNTQVVTGSNGNSLIADITNARLRLPQGNSFQQNNPMTGIQSITVTQNSPNSVRLVVNGTNSPPSGEILRTNGTGLGFNFSPNVANAPVQNSQVLSAQTPPNFTTLGGLPPANGGQVAAGTPTVQVPGLNSSGGSNFPTPVTGTGQLPTPSPLTGGTVLAQNPPPQILAQNPQPSSQPQPLFPNPQIILSNPPAPLGTVQPIAPAPPFLPGAVPPPLGDIATSTVDSSTSFVDLGTATRIPRLVLRDAPIREVLGLLARTANLNLAFVETATNPGTGAGGAATPAAGAAAGAGRTINLEVQDEPIQNVFNTVLQISGFEANRVGRTIFVGPRLPDGARNVVTRSFRLNQVNATAAANFLTTQGAETQIPFEQVQIQTVGTGAAARTVETRTPTILALRATEGFGPLLLRGVSVSADDRLNSITVVGDPRKVEIASNFLTQLDLRRRQVAVNVKIIDINLLGTDAFRSSFSFGAGDGFFVNDGGAASLNFGGTRPSTRNEATGSLVTPAVINNPFSGSQTFIDPNSTITVPGIGSGTLIIQDGRIVQNTTNVDASFFTPTSGVTRNPFQAGITAFTRGTTGTVTSTSGTPAQPPIVNPTTGVVISPAVPAVAPTSTITQGTTPTITTALPSLFQFPRRLLTALQAQITSGNAKILADPTLVVQEGQTARVNLTQEVFGGFNLRSVTTNNITNQVQEPIIKNAGLSLEVVVEGIDDNGFVTMRINPTVSAPAASIDTQQGQITLVQSRDLQSGLVRLRDGQTLILSGVIQETDRTTVSKVPILGDIPILGALFRSTNRENSRQEVVIIVTPQVLDDSDRSNFGYNYQPSRDVQQILQPVNRP